MNIGCVFTRDRKVLWLCGRGREGVTTKNVGLIISVYDEPTYNNYTQRGTTDIFKYLRLK